ncbi:MAG: anhydro-N-acetylmuramic acid kinase [bacterium]|nr:anhydro-N-acetylmuramic acid kinase [bacterium]MDE0602727.1 anhydro-N-acetylmuramic acid kinase [bacterium]
MAVPGADFDSPRILVGVMCGTSGDGISIGMVSTSGVGRERRVKLLRHEVIPYPTEARRQLFRLFPPQRFSAAELGVAHQLFGRLIGAAVLAVLYRSGLGPGDLTAVVTQAPTLIHCPPQEGRDGFHLEIGEPAIISEMVGVPVVADLRPSDVAAGGHGAPLSAYADWVLFSHPRLNRAIQNIGGIANVTFVPADAALDDVLAFDTGPGNMVIDAVVQRLSGGRELFDAGGGRAARGEVHQPLLRRLMDHPYLAGPIPKTSGREDFGEPFAEETFVKAASLGVSDDDLIATVTAFTAECIAFHYQRELTPRGGVDEVVLYGGGANNATLVEMLSRRLAPTRIRFHDEFGIPGDAREAVTWAILGDETLAGRPANVPSASGARHRVVLGKVVSTSGAQAP